MVPLWLAWKVWRGAEQGTKADPGRLPSPCGCSGVHEGRSACEQTEAPSEPPREKNKAGNGERAAGELALNQLLRRREALAPTRAGPNTGKVARAEAGTARSQRRPGRAG